MKTQNPPHITFTSLLLSLAVTGFIYMNSAGSDGADPPEKKKPPVKVRVTMQDLRDHSRENKDAITKSVKVSDGETLEIAIETQPLGYLWELQEHDKQKFTHQKMPPQPNPDPKGIGVPGKKAEKLFLFTVNKADGKLEFIPTRSSGEPDPNTPTIKVIVSPK